MEVSREQMGLGASLEPRPKDSPVPLTASQRNLWRYTRQLDAATIGAVASASRIIGALQVERLRQSLEALVHRHGSLRTRIVAVHGAPVQRIDAPGAFTLECVDLSTIAAARAHAYARHAAAEFCECDVDVSAGPLFRALLLRLSAQEHVLVLAADHMICDGASAAIMNKEIWALYRQSAPSLPAPPVQFADVAVWQERTYPAWRAQHEMYWRERLRGVPQMSLPVGSDSAASLGRASAASHTPFGKNLSVELRELAKREQVRLLHVVLAAHACTVSRWIGQRDLVVALATNGRHWHPALKDMIGCLAAGLLLRIEVREEDTFVALLRRIRDEFDAAFDHYDFDRLAELLQFTTELNFNWVSPTILQGPRALAEREEASVRVLPFPLKLAWLGKLFPFVGDTPSGIVATLTYRPDLILPTTIERLGSNLRAFASAMAARPSSRIGSVETS